MIEKGEKNKVIELELQRTHHKFNLVGRFVFRRELPKLKKEFIKDSLTPGSGRVYYSRAKGGIHKASAPGQTPRKITGKLNKGLKTQQSSASGFFSNTTEYAKYLELGTKNADGTKRMEARPGMQNAIKKRNCRFMKFLEESLEKEFKA